MNILLKLFEWSKPQHSNPLWIPSREQFRVLSWRCYRSMMAPPLLSFGSTTKLSHSGSANTCEIHAVAFFAVFVWLPFTGLWQWSLEEPLPMLIRYWFASRIQFNYWLHCQWLYHPFFLNLSVSRTKIDNLKWQIGRKINHVTFGKFATSLVQNLKILLGVYKKCWCWLYK